MNRFRVFAIAALMLPIALGGPALLGKAPKPPKKPAPKVQRPKARPAPKPKPQAKPKQAHPKAPKKAAPKAKAQAKPKVKPPVHKPAKAKGPPRPPILINHKPKEVRRPTKIHKFAQINERTRKVEIDKRWWHSVVTSSKKEGSSTGFVSQGGPPRKGAFPGGASPGETPAEDPDLDPPEPPSGVIVLPPVIRAGQGLPASRTGHALTALLNGMDVESHWLPGRRVGWKTGNPISQESGPASNGCAFVTAVCARLKVPMPPPTAENFLPDSQYDWLLTKGKSKGWKAVAVVEAQLLANQGWVVIVAWMNPAPAGERTSSGLTAIVRPDEASAEELIGRGPRIIMVGERNHNSIILKEAFPPQAWQEKKIVYFAHRP